MAMAFSCQDHYVPDPDPVSNCNRVDGTPRAFPCEFEITKLEFLKTTTNLVVRTVLPGSPDVQLPLDQAYQLEYGSQGAYAQVVFRVLLHIKRIANASFQPVGGYEVSQFRISDPEPPYPAIYNDIIGSGPGGNVLPASPAKNPVNLDMTTGETRVIESQVGFVYSFNPSQPKQVGAFYFSIVNNTTSLKLAAAPYSYNLLRDIHEARIVYEPRAW